MRSEEDFESKQHVTKHLTLGRYGRLEEASEVNSAAEMDYLNWTIFLGKYLDPDKVSPFIFKTITDAAVKYRKAYSSYAFGIIGQIKTKWVWILVGSIIAIVAALYFLGFLNFGGH